MSASSHISQQIQNVAAAIEQDIIAWRRNFHAYPELSGKELGTQEIICTQLDAWGVPYKKVAGTTGVIATIGGGRQAGETAGCEAAAREGAAEAAAARDAAARSAETSAACEAAAARENVAGCGVVEAAAARDAVNAGAAGVPLPHRCVALRTDIDALPVTEQTGLDFASENEGVMHACGHDCHMAMMLGATHILWTLRDRLAGSVRVIFQPAEENSSGARWMIAAGALEGVDAIYGAHIWSEVPAGKFSCEAGQRMANTDWFRIDIAGVSAHGSMPHKGVDAIVVAAEMVLSLQVLVSRDVSPFEPVVITVGEIHGGEARNVMAGSAYLTGTVRTWTPESRADISSRMQRIVDKIATAFGAQASFSFEAGNGCLTNNAGCAAVAQQAVREQLGEDALFTYEGTLAGEDYSEYLAHVPGVFVFVGTHNEAVGATYPQHSCYYTVDESVLVGGAQVAAQWAFDMLA